MSYEHDLEFERGVESRQREVDRLYGEVDDLRRGISEAINELRRWQYSSDPEDIRHSIDMAIQGMQRL